VKVSDVFSGSIANALSTVRFVRNGTRRKRRAYSDNCESTWTIERPSHRFYSSPIRDSRKRARYSRFKYFEPVFYDRSSSVWTSCGMQAIPIALETAAALATGPAFSGCKPPGRGVRQPLAGPKDKYNQLAEDPAPPEHVDIFGFPQDIGLKLIEPSPMSRLALAGRGGEWRLDASK
jgi:hypothetical protein